jgi:hypothetical protein
VQRLAEIALDKWAVKEIGLGVVVAYENTALHTCFGDVGNLERGAFARHQFK